MTPPPPPDDDRRDDPDAVVRVVRAGHDGDVPTVIEGLASTAPDVRAGAVGAVVRLAGRGVVEHPRATAAVVRALADGDVGVRRRGAGEAARLATTGPPPDDVATLVSALVDRLHAPDEDDRVVEVAAFALGELPLDASRSAHPAALDAAVDALVPTATSHPEHMCREAAVAALGSIGDPRGLAAVLAGCRDRANVRRRAVLALAAFDDPAATDELERLTADRDLQVRQAAEELWSIGSGEPT